MERTRNSLRGRKCRSRKVGADQARWPHQCAEGDASIIGTCSCSRQVAKPQTRRNERSKLGHLVGEGCGALSALLQRDPARLQLLPTVCSKLGHLVGEACGALSALLQRDPARLQLLSTVCKLIAGCPQICLDRLQLMSSNLQFGTNG